MKFSQNQRNELLDRLRKALPGKTLRRIDGSRGDWSPEANDCHTNVVTWWKGREIFPPAGAAYGWLVTTFEDGNGNIIGCYFDTHSAIRLPTGEVVEITPMLNAFPVRFIEHPGSDEEFLMLLNFHRVNRLEILVRPKTR